MRLYVCGSFRFMQQINELEQKLEKENIDLEIPNIKQNHGILNCLEKIDDADVVYVVNPDGYVGKSVCVDMGYAYAKGKPIYVMHSIDDPLLMKMVKRVLSFEELTNFLKRSKTFDK